MASSVLKDIFIFVYFYKYLLITHQVSVGELDTRDMKIGKQTFQSKPIGETHINVSGQCDVVRSQCGTDKPEHYTIQIQDKD